MKLKYCNSTAVESSASSDPPQLSNHDYIFTPHLVLCPPPARLIRITTTVTMLKNSRILHLSSETWCFDELWETRLLLWLLSFTLTPPPSPSASLHWVVLIPHYVQFHICHRSRGSYAVVALGHTRMLKCSSSRQVFPIPERPVVYLRCCF